MKRKNDFSRKPFLLLLLCLAGGLWLFACGKKGGAESSAAREPTGSSQEQSEALAGKENAGNSAGDSSPNKNAALKNTAGKSAAEKDAAGKKKGTGGEAPRILALDKTVQERGEWEEEAVILLARGASAQLTLEKECAEAHPALAKTLTELAAMQKNTMEDEFENLVSFAREEYAAETGTFRTYVSTMDVHLRRADTVVLSLLEDSFANHGEIQGQWLRGYSYDAESGQALKVSEVIRDMGKLPALVTKEMSSHMWMTDEFNEELVREYFARTPEEELSWTLDYNGVTFYFDPEALFEGSPMACSTLLFEKYKDVFREKYRTAEKAYMLELPMNAPFQSDFNGDERLDEISLMGTAAEALAQEGSAPYYTGFGIYTDIDGFYHYEDMFAYDFHSYFVKTAEGASYLYLFAEQNDIQNRSMSLHVYELKTGEITKRGEMLAGPYYKPEGYLPDDKFSVPTDPESFFLDDFEDDSRRYEFEDGVYKLPEAVAYRTGTDGLPVRK